MLRGSQIVLGFLAFAPLLGVTPSGAAEITCIQQFGNSKIPEDLASKLWPSGFRPSASTCQAALLQGTIEKGDYERYKANADQYCEFVKAAWADESEEAFDNKAGPAGQL